LTTYPKITIITPSFNQGKFIEETILSIIGQNYPNLQYIIIDGGSSDETLSIIKKYESKIDYWISEKDSGQSEALNKGLLQANGDLVNWINSDDQLAENALFDIASHYQAHVEANVFIGQIDFYKKNEHVGKSGKVLFSNRACAFAFGQINQPATFFKLSVLKKLGGLKETLHYCMDVELWLNYLLHYELNTIYHSTNTWAKFRFHDESKTISEPANFKLEKESIYNAIFNFYGITRSNNHLLKDSHYPKSTTLNLQEAFNYYNLWQSDMYCLEGNLALALQYWRKVNFFKLILTEKRRYFAVLKNMLLKKLS